MSYMQLSREGAVWVLTLTNGENRLNDDVLAEFNTALDTIENTEGNGAVASVKPIKLMQYLVRLITPSNGIVLDPFNGSGTTGIACKLENIQYVGMELDAEYCKIAQARIDNFVEEKEKILESTISLTNQNKQLRKELINKILTLKNNLSQYF